MIVKEFGTPRPHLIITEVFSEKVLEGFLQEAVDLKDIFKPGKMGKFKDNVQKTTINDKRKKAMDIYLDDYYTDRSKSKILTKLDAFMINNKMRDIYDNCRYPIFTTILFTTIDATHLIRYKDGDYYDWHGDVFGKAYGFTTISFMFGSKKKMFTGGAFQLKYKDEVKTIPFKRNTLIIFPSNTMHRATTVKMKSTDPYHLRYTIQRWNT